MATNPTPEVLAALRSAAEQTKVPLSLLWGVAFAESGFDASKIGPYTKTGEQAKGLMQLMPAIIASYGVADPFDAAQSALGGAQLLAKLGKALKWNWQDMLAAYVWGPTAFARARAQGEPIPAEVLTYVRRALAARDVYRNKAGRPRGTSTLVQALNAATEALAQLNPSWAPATQSRDAWRPFWASNADLADEHAAARQDVKAYWRNYQIAYERAPITDHTTPPPSLIEPSFWKQAGKTIDAAVETAKDIGEKGLLTLGGGLFLFALFWFAVGDRRR